MRGWRKLVLSEIDQQCRFAMLAYQDATKALETRQADRFWYSLQALLGAGSALSHLLWPADECRHVQAGELRLLLRVNEASPLAPQAISGLKRVDEAISTWLQAGPSEFYPAMLRTSAFEQNDPSRYGRFFDSEQSLAVMFGARVSLSSLLCAIADLQRREELEMLRLRRVV